MLFSTTPLRILLTELQRLQRETSLGFGSSSFLHRDGDIQTRSSRHCSVVRQGSKPVFHVAQDKLPRSSDVAPRIALSVALEMKVAGCNDLASPLSDCPTLPRLSILLEYSLHQEWSALQTLQATKLLGLTLPHLCTERSTGAAPGFVLSLFFISSNRVHV